MSTPPPEARATARHPAIAALWIADYRRYWLGAALTGLGLNLWFLGAAWLVLELGGSALHVGLISGLAAAPSILLSVVGGALTDRVDRRRMLVAARCVWALVALGVGGFVALGTIETWHVLLASAAFGIADAASTPAGHTLLIDIVGKARLVATNALEQVSEFGGELVAPLAVGLLIASWGSPPGFLVAGVLIALGAVSMARIRHGGAGVMSDESPRALLSDIGEGLRYTLRTRPFPMLLALSALSLLSAAAFPLVPLYARDVLEVGPSGFGALSAALAAGMFLGALLLAAVGEVARPGAVIVGTRATWFLAMAAFALSESFALSMALLLLMGLVGAVSTNLTLTQFQVHADDRMRGRVMSVQRIADSLDPLGAVVGGALAAAWTGEAALLGCAVVGLAVLAGLARTAMTLRSAPECALC